ncbi:OmpA family protein [Halovulum dunhuangense]|uniref:OmpA family protein n=1 Tax=Halovulum dunhuangense TaxID=1505036 RepID=A0A849L4Q8_9RHOB|nr:OmpA family protein [Halovulum dunhuangense]NNU81243.1 OmpA family protein [Halovulum dunhuangense]
MKSLLKKATAVSAIALMAGCTNQVAGDISNSSFGAATSSNTLAQVVSLRGGLLIDLQNRFRQAAPDMINFEFDRAELDAEARSILDRQANWIRANPAITFRVYGHTDLVGSNAYNQSLGLRRAQAAVNYLVSRGVRRGQVEAVASFGETRPVVATSDPERLNRRTVTEIVGFDRRFGDFDFDGKVANNIYTSYASTGGGGE